MRFTSPSLGGHRQNVSRAGTWELGVAYRRLTSDKFFVGTERHEASAPNGQPNFTNVKSVALTAAYAVSDRLSLTLTVPFTHGWTSRFMPDTVRHENEAGNLGDISLVGDFWLLGPPGLTNGNVALGLGIKAPTGRTARDAWFAGNGSVVRRPVDETIQPGDGGWGILVQLQAFQRVLPRTSAYFIGRYLLSPEEESEVPSPGIAGVNIAIPDVYSAAAGVAFEALPTLGISLSLGARLDGVPRRDLIGGEAEDSLFRRPGYVLFADPGLAVTRGRGEFTFSLPIRLHQNFRQSVLQEARCSLPRLQCPRQFRGGGGVADYLIHAAYTHRF